MSDVVMRGVDLFILTAIIVPLAVNSYPLQESKKLVYPRSILNCPVGRFYNNDQQACHSCTPCGKGTAVDYCEESIGPGSCRACDAGWYQDEEHYVEPSCKQCQHCLNRVVISRCTRISDTVCGGCRPGYFEKLGACRRCSTSRGKKPEACKPKPKMTSPPPVLEEYIAQSATVSRENDDPTSPTQATDLASQPPTTITKLPTVTKAFDVSLPEVDTDESSVNPSNEIVTWPMPNGPNIFSMGSAAIAGVLVLVVTICCAIKCLYHHISLQCRGVWSKRRKSGNASMTSEDGDTFDGETMEMLQVPGDLQGNNVLNGGLQGNNVPNGELQGNNVPNGGLQGNNVPNPAGRFADLVLQLQEETDDDFLKSLKQYFILAEELTPNSADSIGTLAVFVTTVMDQNIFSEFDVMKRVFKAAKIRKMARVCSIIESSHPDFAVPAENQQCMASGEEEDYYLGRLQRLLRENNILDMRNSQLQNMPDLEKLVEKDVKHCGDLYEIAKDLGVDDTIAHKLKRYKSMQNILEMTKPDLKVVELAKVLYKHKRVAAVKLLYEKVKDRLTHIAGGES
ncbi:uncharacterized protein [Apostichopus japonicus]|uniref:uncharacterized protein isoform X2 n=1 Tax=Stichopus japonicus TaxID=307972 RepID=UPI003AB6F72B